MCDLICDAGSSSGNGLGGGDWALGNGQGSGSPLADSTGGTGDGNDVRWFTARGVDGFGGGWSAGYLANGASWRRWLEDECALCLL